MTSSAWTFAFAVQTLLAQPTSAELEEVRQIRRIQDAALAGSDAFALVESLTTEVGPRLAGTEAEARARGWAVRTCTTLGFDRVRVEEATVEGWVRGVERAEIVAPFPQRLAVTALGLSIATPQDGIEAEVVRFGSLAEMQDALPGTAKGKIVFIDRAMPKTQDGSGYGAVIGIRSKGPTAAARLGAAAVLIRSVGTDHHRFPHTGMLRYQPEQAPPIPAGALAVPDADQLTRILGYKAEVRLRLVLRPRFVGPKPTGNVIAELVGTERPDEIVLLGAHLDSWDLGTGAVDDGAGVGIVLASAALLKRLELQPKRTIRVVLFGAEEVGLVGAKAYAKAHQDELDQHIAAAESDFGAGRIYQFSASVSEGAWPKVEDIQRHLVGLNVILGNNRSGGGPDLIPLKSARVPILAPKQDGRDYFDVHHTADDVLDRVDADNLDQNVAVYATMAHIVANSDVDFRADATAAAER
ncbi:MAG: M20/M25/M40 family metallo-hydrolase [Myxococcota bacterium]